MKYFLGICLCFFLPSGNTIIEHLVAKSETENKLIAVYFSGSDWCSSCYKFKKNVLSDNQVEALLKSRYIYYNADFPQRTKLADSTVTANDFLAEKLNPEGLFPLLVIVDANWNIKAQYNNANLAADVQQQLSSLQQ